MAFIIKYFYSLISQNEKIKGIIFSKILKNLNSLFFLKMKFFSQNENKNIKNLNKNVWKKIKLIKIICKNRKNIIGIKFAY